MKNFAEEIEVMNNRNVFSYEKEALEISLKTTRMEEENQRKVVKIFEDWHEEFLVEWDEEHKRNIVDSIRKGQKEKMKLELGVYNFSDHEIDKNITEILKQGKKTVIPIDKGIETAVGNFDKELLNYLINYRRKVERKPRIEIESEEVKVWLEKAIQTSNDENDEYTQFYKGMIENLDKAYRHIERESKCGSENVKANDLRRKLNFHNHVWNEADKGLGFILLPCESLIKAEKESYKTWRRDGE